jgi:hypothetical protein
MPRCWWGPSCGERYWGDFYSDPPDCWDPCDCHGNYNGGGQRNCGCNGGPGHPAAGAVQDDGSDGKVISESDQVVNPNLKPAAQPHRAKPQPAADSN